MKTAVTGEDRSGSHRLQPLAARAGAHYRFQPRACRPYRAKTKGKVERPFSYIRQDFFLGRSFRNLEILTLSSPTGSIPSPMSASTAPPSASSPRLSPTSSPNCRRCPHRFDAVLKLERRVSHDGFVAIGGNYYSVPDRTRRVVEVQQLPDLIRILDLGTVVAEHPVLEGRKQYRIDRTTAPAAARNAR